MTMYDYIGLCMTMYDMYDHVWLCMTLYDYIWLCMTMYDFVWLCLTKIERSDKGNPYVIESVCFRIHITSSTLWETVDDSCYATTKTLNIE